MDEAIYEAESALSNTTKLAATCFQGGEKIAENKS
jgi:hypothetical protein